MKKSMWVLHTGPHSHWQPRALAALVIALVIIGGAVPLAGAAPESQAQDTLVIGYLGAAEADTANGARLAMEQINSIGGVTLPNGNTYQ